MIDAAQNIRNLKQVHEGKKPRTRYINPKSEKRVIEEKEYLEIKKKRLEKKPVCEFPGCKLLAVDVHHGAGRVGKNYLDESEMHDLCRKHHTFCELNPKESKKLGLSHSRLKKA